MHQIKILLFDKIFPQNSLTKKKNTYITTKNLQKKKKKEESKNQMKE